MTAYHIQVICKLYIKKACATFEGSAQAFLYSKFFYYLSEAIFFSLRITLPSGVYRWSILSL
jgi:hypothetical protein